MPLAPGDKLGPYEILAPIGAGGMGEVYKARDTRLDRTVAVKVLPEHIAQREDLRARFEREARAVASLNHPNICTLHDIGHHGSTGYMVMEMIEGETLAARLAKGPLPLDQALKIAAQIAAALDRAHRAGVTHRDVKPQNIMLTRDGVKVLDFGLAKSAGATAKPGPAEETLTKALTTEGTVMGTPQYMAPEQFEGREGDARSDIWAFGAVLYEMVAGRKAFEGKTYASLVGAILSADPAPIAVHPVTPSWLERLVRRCLEKDPEDRYFSMHDVALDLRTPPPQAEPVAAAAHKATRWPWMALAGFAALAAILGWGPWFRASNGATQVTTLDVTPPPGAVPGGTLYAEISPDGRMLAFIATTDKARVYLRALDSLEAHPLAGTEGATSVSWSPDSKSLVIGAAAMLKRFDLATGTSVTLAAVDGRNVSAFRGTWSEDGMILFDGGQQLQLISASGGVAKAVLPFGKETGETRLNSPHFLPGGKQFLFVRLDNADPAKMGIWHGSLDGKPPALILPGVVSNVRYDPAAKRILYLRGAGGSLVAQRLELDPPRVSGEPENLTGSSPASLRRFDFSISRTGILFHGRTLAREGELRWRDRSGKLIESAGPLRWNNAFRLSPDGRRTAFTYIGPPPEVWVRDMDRAGSSPLIFSAASQPVWSPDGKAIYYRDSRTLSRKPADGSGVAAVVASGYLPGLQSVSPDGKTLLFGLGDLFLLPLGDGQQQRQPQPYLQTPAFEGSARFSPDGRWVAYDSNETGKFEVSIQGFPERSGKFMVSVNGGFRPEWRADGKEIYWVSNGVLTAASVELLAGGVRIGRPQPLFPAPTGWYQPTGDGRKFLVLEAEDKPAEDPPMTVVLNWAAGLKR